VHVESFNTQLNPQQSDSLSKMTSAYTLEVIDNSGKTTAIRLHLKPASKSIEDEYGNIIPFDLDYFWGITDDGEVAMAQSYNFSPLLNPISKFSPVY
jgi:hypothetical protein